MSRATIPAEFLDRTSAELLLQAEPEYFHANLILNATKVRVDFGGKIGLPIPDRQITVSGVPGYSNMQDLMQQLAGNPDTVYSAAIKVVPEFMENGVGHTIKINRPKFTDSTYTKPTRRIAVGTAISKTPITMGSEQATITVERFGGPYDNTNSQIQPFGFERFDLYRMLHDPNAIKELHLVRDFRKALDRWGVDLLDNGDAIYPTGMSADNDSTVVGDFPFSYELITIVSKEMKEGKVPRFSNGRYMMVITPYQAQQLAVDDQYLRLVRYHKDINPVFNMNHRGTVGDIDIFESVTLNTVANSSLIPIQYGQCFGPQSVGWGMTEMPRIATDSDDNYGETAKLIWLWYCGFDVLNSGFQRSVRTS
jgi:hypothetical protein